MVKPARGSYSVSYGYDNGGRLQTVSQGGSTATYDYLPNSPLVNHVTFTHNSATWMTTTKQYDRLNRLQSIASAASGSAAPPSPLSYVYTYNAAGQRIRATLADDSYWVYTYDSLGQVTAGKRYWQEGTPVTGQQFEYGFDTIGNRTSTGAGGDASGGHLRYAGYTANSLNQYVSRTVPRGFDILGLVAVTNTVSVNGQTPYRKGEYFRGEVLVDNSSAPVWTNIPVTAPGQTTQSGNVFVPPASETFTNDVDGNLTRDGRWTNYWDAENRLVKMETLPNAPTGSRRRLEFGYDHQSRRIWKRVTNLDTSAVTEQRFLYDGWNLLAALDTQQAAILSSFVWGLDLSGTMQGAGGVGGLLKVTCNGAQTANSFVAYDGNGNVSGLVDASDGSVAARYDYGPFGEVIRATGPMARGSPFRFSTKYQDDETDLLYYGYRYYATTTGRWLSRDPKEESGGLPLYCNSGNDVINGYDFLGLKFGRRKCAPGVILWRGPWAKFWVGPSGDYAPTGDGGGISSGVHIIYRHQVKQVFSCCCSLITNTVYYYHDVEASSERGEILWYSGPAGPWPPIDWVEIVIDMINHHVHEPVLGKRDKPIVDNLITKNLPDAKKVLGTLRNKDIPTRWCWL
jgi:RHS repeat-associated protein